ncbi:FAD-dependent oxidoreductase [Arcobacter vandammei]|uniref:FAD-dependent oxidoreductase n=1 Tax=Arcobacter vandammei TaxID=2782243 RepID=UPI0018E05C64|nr:FAD-dependent oxidoreductase [Arcobacter vandammei]
MNKNELRKALEIVDMEIKKAGISRRDALKMAGLGGAAFLAGGSQAQAATIAKASSEAKGKIVIIGGGLAGVSTAARLMNTLTNADITIIEPNSKSVSYQPGTTLVASGVYKSKDELLFDTKDYMPKGVKWIKEKAIEFNPEANKVTLSNKEVIDYDYLIVAAGITLDYGAIKGLEEVGDAYSAGDASKILKAFGDSGVTSVYNIDSSAHMWEQTQKFIERAKKEKVNAIFTAPNTAVKCGGAPKKVMYLVNSRLNEAKARANATLTYYDDGGKLFSVKEYADAIEKQFIARDMKWNFSHNLTGVDIANKIATFDKHWEEQGEYDEDLKEHDIIKKHMNVEVPFDFLHITPPQKAPDEIGKSPIGSAKGWIPVNKESLQHVKYKNIFAIGDIAAVPMGKTGGTVRKQYKVLVDNLISVMEGKEPTAKFEGYTVCPLITDIGTVMLAEFDWSGKPTPSFPIDPTQERWIWWLLKVYLLKPMTMYGMLSGKA